MICPHCNQNHPDTAQFCPTTGRPIPSTGQHCGNCGKPLKADVRFCPYCGQAQGFQAGPIIPQRPTGRSRTRLYVLAGLAFVSVIILAAYFYVWPLLKPEPQPEAVFITDTPIPDFPPRAMPSKEVTRAVENPIEKATLKPTQPAMIEPIAQLTLQPSLSPQPPLFPTSTATSERLQGPYAGWIIYAYGMNTSREIYLLNPASGETRQVTANRFRDEAPSMSPDGTMIVFASYRSPDLWELYTLNLISGAEKEITKFNGMARWPAWSPVQDDDRILFEGRESKTGRPNYMQNIWMAHADGSDMERLTDSGVDEDPEWSPDGKSIIFVRALSDTNSNGMVDLNDNKDIFQLDLDSMVLTNLTNTPKNDDFDTSWSFDGQWIVFCSVRGDADGNRKTNLDDSRDLYIIRPDGSQENRIDLGNLRTFDPNWSPDGTQILFGVDLGDNIEELWIYTLDGNRAEKITPSGPYFHPEWGK